MSNEGVQKAIVICFVVMFIAVIGMIWAFT